jgi:transcriptional regulator with XRE-family HTH domain
LQDGNVGKRIKERREELNISVADLAERLSMSKATVHRYENGEIKNIKIPVAMAIAHELKVSAAWLLGKTEHKQRYESQELAVRYKEVTNVVQDLIVYLSFRTDLTLHGKTMSESDRQSMIAVFELLMKLANAKYGEEEK